MKKYPLYVDGTVKAVHQQLVCAGTKRVCELYKFRKAQTPVPVLYVAQVVRGAVECFR